MNQDSLIDDLYLENIQEFVQDEEIKTYLNQKEQGEELPNEKKSIEPKTTKRKYKRKLKVQQAIHQEGQGESASEYDVNINKNIRTRRSKSSFTTNLEQESDDNELIQSNGPETKEQIINPKVQFIIWKKVEAERQVFLAKFHQRSYLHCKWYTKDDLKAMNVEFTFSILKSMQARMKKTNNLKLSESQYFNPNFVKVDRILSSTEEIVCISPKLLTQIKGHWSQSMYLVCAKLLNFMKNNCPFCLHFTDPFTEQQLLTLKNENPVTITKVFNKILLEESTSYEQIWKQIGTSLQNYLTFFNQKVDTDVYIIGQTIKEAAIFLYMQWYQLSKKRYNELKSKKIIQGILEPFQEKHFDEKKSFLKIADTVVDLEEHFCQQNVLLSINSVDEPASKSDIMNIHPKKKNLRWFNKQKFRESYQFTYLTFEDLQQLNLNRPIDKIYLVKWKDLSYEDITWQKESSLKSSQKIEEFYRNCKYPSADVEKQLLKQTKLHAPLLEWAQKQSEKQNYEQKSDKLMKYQNELYFLGTKQESKVYSKQNSPVFKNYRKLKDFQLESLNWMINNWHVNRSCILADEMGLGKTIQTIAFLYHLYNIEKVPGPFLILAPLTTLPQWRKEIEEWTNFNCLLYYDEGNISMRQIIRNLQFYYTAVTEENDIVHTKIPKFHILLTNYEIFMKDFDCLKKIAFQHIVLDEAHRLKNRNSKITIFLNKLPCCRKLLLTGTPIQNNTKQLWTLLNFIEQSKYASIQTFEQKYGVLKSEEQVKKFRQQLKPYLLRRIKEDVETTIPKLSELIISVEMTNEQKKYYRGLLQKNKIEMVRALNNANFNSISMQLRKCCNHPYLIAPDIEEDIKRTCQNEEEQQVKFMKSSGKVILLLKLLDKFKKEGKKVLLFSQFVTMLDLLKPFIESRNFTCELLKGSQTSTLRHQAITRFNEQNNKTDVFLISTKAGGVGINLVSASQVIIFDSDWNPQNDIQATARAHRIGQKKQVTVYRLITASSYQSEMFQISSRKLGLDKAIFTGEFFKSSNSKKNDEDKLMNKEEIQMLLKRGVLGFLQNEKNNEEFFNQSIEDIIENNSKKIEYNTGQSSFTKTTFNIEGKQGISIDAPDFWERALRNVQTPLDKLIKKTDTLIEYDSLQKQQELMIEAYTATYVFVKQKTLSSSFNAEEEINLIKFFNAVQNQRHFHKKYRTISGELIQEIDKPSRRFRVRQEDLYITTITKEEPEQEEDESEQKQIQDMKEEKQSTMKAQVLEASAGQTVKINDFKTIDNFEKLCYLCWKPKCLLFCSGVCGRSFHLKCWQTFNKGSSKKIDVLQIKERSLNFEEWRQNVDGEEKCESCKTQNYNFECAICLRGGVFDLMINSNKEKYKKFAGQFNGDMLFKCNMRNCSKFYHLNCLYNQKYDGKFADKAGKVSKNTKQKSILFRCPSHYCFVCYNTDSQFSKSRPISCALCSMTMHLKCMKQNQFTKIRKSTYICTKHLEHSQHRFLVDEFKLFSEKRTYKKQPVRYQSDFTERISKLKQKNFNKDKNKVTENPLFKVETEPKEEVKKQNHNFKYSYKDFGVAPVTQFDFMTYKGNWCRYCGSRFTQTFKKGPWGKSKLCYHHFVSWKKKKLDLSNYKRQPKEPIDKTRQTELKYLNLMQQDLKLRPIQTILRLKEMMMEQQIQEEQRQRQRIQRKQQQVI